MPDTPSHKPVHQDPLLPLHPPSLSFLLYPLSLPTQPNDRPGPDPLSHAATIRTTAAHRCFEAPAACTTPPFAIGSSPRVPCDTLSPASLCRHFQLSALDWPSVHRLPIRRRLLPDTEHRTYSALPFSSNAPHVDQEIPKKPPAPSASLGPHCNFMHLSLLCPPPPRACPT